MTVALYSVTMFVSAGLLFLIQPMFARMLLPLLGGSPSVWNTAVVFFQSVLLAGYLYAHATTRRLGVRRQALVHSVLILLPLVLLPIAVPAGWSPPSDGNPIPWLLALLFVAVGLPFFVVSTTSPLLQTWFAHTGHRMAADPYFLYAGSNIGSMLALLGYPLLMEPGLRLAEQSHIWTAGYGALVVLLLLCALSVRRSGGVAETPAATQVVASPRPSTRRRLRWVLLAFVPSSLMLSTTTYLATSIAPIPLIWVIPLALYLLTFILVFAGRRIVPRRLVERALPIVLVPQLMLLCGRFTEPAAIILVPYLVTFFIAALVCHAALADDRPESDRLTEFFVWLSVGGVLGGVFNALLAPVLFSSVVEYPLALVLLCALMPDRSGSRGPTLRPRSLLPAVAPGLCLAAVLIGLRLTGRPMPAVVLLAVFGGAITVTYSFSRRPVRFALAVAGVITAAWVVATPTGRVLLHAERSFFGIHRVLRDASGDYLLAHGSTVHGRQSGDPARRREPLTYFAPTGPIGETFDALRQANRIRSVAVVGLGAGTLACYATAGEPWTFYEIDPAVVRIARDPRYFTYLRDCAPDAAIVLGDARLSMAKAEAAAFDLIVLDAFSSDAPPVHLLTREALQLYLDALTPDGIIAFHISNRYLDLRPVVAALAADAGLVAFSQDDLNLSAADVQQGKMASRWAVLGRSPEDLAGLATDPRWQRLEKDEGVSVWRDDYSSILQLLLRR